MRLSAFTDRRRRMPLQWVIIVLLSAIGASAQAGWQCAEQPNGLWECSGPPPPPENIAADDNIFTPEDTDTGFGEIADLLYPDTQLVPAVIVVHQQGAIESHARPRQRLIERNLVPAVLVQYLGAHRLAVFGAELEDVTHLDSAANVQAALAIGAGIAIDDVAQVRNPGQREVPFPVSAGEVSVFFVSAAHKIGHGDRAVIGNHGDLQPDRSE